MREWLVPCNPVKYGYDVLGAFAKLGRINWGQTVKNGVEPGDTAYVYLAAPYEAIRLKCRISKAGLGRREAVIDDSEFSRGGGEDAAYERYMELELLEVYDSPRLSRSSLKGHGLTQVQSMHGISPELSAHLARETARLVDGADEAACLEEVDRSVPQGPSERFVFRGRKKRKTAPKIYNGQSVCVRSRQTARNALSHAGYACEVDSGHPTFLRKNSDKGYTELHHLVPLCRWAQFDVSLDVEENIVSLCSCCHDQIHYGQGGERLLEKLYEARREDMEKAGISVTLEELLRMYS